MSNAQPKQQQSYQYLEAVLDHQERISTLSQQIQSIETAISDLNAKLAATRDGRPSTDALEQRRMNLLAAEALGQVTEAEREAQESEIDCEAAQLKERFASTDQSISRMEAALSGLRGQREKASEKLVALHALTPEVIEPLLVAEGGIICERYVDAAVAVTELYLQLMSLGAILSSVTAGDRTPRRIRGLDTGRFFIPSFNLSPCTETVHPKEPGKLFAADRLDYGEAQNEELARLHALGVTLI